MANATVQKTYLYLLRPRRPRFTGGMTEEEERRMQEHFAFLKELLAKGRLLLAGPCEDAAFGVVLFRAGSFEEARATMEGDPAIRHGVAAGEVRPFRVSLLADAAVWSAP